MGGGVRRSRTLAWIVLAGIVLAGIVAPLQVAGEDAVRPGANDLPAGSPAEYDPFAGLDPDGRIPQVARPADMKHPQRWRYIPEGRIKPGNVFERFLVSSAIAPFVSQDKDVGTGFGKSCGTGSSNTTGPTRD